MLIILADTNKNLGHEWVKAFDSFAVPGVEVEIHHDNILNLSAECIVSPANSYGFMDGGIDLAYINHFGWDVQRQLQTLIRHRPMQELLVGEALTVDTGHESFPNLIAAPTMRVPMILPLDTVNPYLATRAALAEATHCESIAFPGMGTGVGRVPLDVCAKQMRQAIDDHFGRRSVYAFPGSWHIAQTRHQLLYGDQGRDLQNPA